jgi:delta14-sterol reductase
MVSGSLLAGWFAPLAVYLAILILHLALPARRVDGYALDPGTGQPLTYRLNGLVVFALVTSVWLAAGWKGWISWDWLYVNRWSAMGGACLVGLAYSLITVLGAPPTGRSLLADLYLGRPENPQHFNKRVDAKMFLYLAGAVLLGLNTLSATAFHAGALGSASNPGVYLHAALLTFFVLDYLVFERVHLYTYDLFAERVGLKLGWGCLAFYPFFYPVGLWGTAHLGKPSVIAVLGWIWLALSALVFLSGWVLARGANLQKYVFKRFPERAFLGRFPPRVIHGGNLALLCGGFWGVARHVNYLGEILMATGLAMSLGHLDSPWPWLYPLYYLALLVPRERDDDRRCAEKYGTLWDEYRRRVPYRIVPRIY